MNSIKRYKLNATRALEQYVKTTAAAAATGDSYTGLRLISMYL